MQNDEETENEDEDMEGESEEEDDRMDEDYSPEKPSI